MIESPNYRPQADTRVTLIHTKELIMASLNESGKSPISRSISSFWRAVLRFGSPRFTTQSIIELGSLKAANDEVCELDAENTEQAEAC